MERGEVGKGRLQGEGCSSDSSRPSGEKKVFFFCFVFLSTRCNNTTEEGVTV